MRRRVVIRLLAALLALGPLGEASAQRWQAPRPNAKPPEKEKEKEPPPPAEAPPPPYERELLRLSEIIGALAFLREICAAPDAGEWPARMKALMEAEGGTQARRDRLAGAYNRGYRGYAVTYHGCTASATEATARYLNEGEQLSQSIAARYGG